ncbi:MAG: PAS domain S-box protein [Bacteroidales bacterium]|nr:PAS domain S-box protein [Bacteroidales bacterium]
MRFFSKNDERDSLSNLSNNELGGVNITSFYATLLVDAQKKILDVNQEFIKVFGYTNDDILGSNIDILNSNKYQEPFYQDIYDTVEKGGVFSDNILTKTKSGEIILCHLKIIPIQENGKVIKYIVIYDQINQEKSLNQFLGDTNDLFLEMIKHTPDIICFKDGDGKWLLANDADLELFQINGVDYVGKTDADLAEYTHPLYKDAFLTCMDTDEACWEKGEISRSDETIPLPDGGIVILDVFKIPTYHVDGSRKSLIVLGRDVSQRRAVERDLKESMIKAEESDRLKSTFLATMSHELRTPLNAVLGFSDLIYEEKDIGEVHEYSRIINNNGQMLLSLIEDLFDISLIESDQMQVSIAQTDLVELIHEVYEIFPMEISILNRLNLKVFMDIHPSQLVVQTDYFRVKQILTNLLRNALKFTQEGEIVIRLREEADHVQIIVEDTGIGIEPEKLAYIFKIFRQGEDGLSRRFGGAGLGLAISKKLSDLLGGNLTATSELNKGSRFVLRLPKK